MKKIFTVFFVVFFASMNCYADFEMMKIKHRAKKGFTNNERAIYEYRDDNDIEAKAPQKIGNVEIGRNSHVREVYVGVNIHKHLRFNKNRRENTLNIGNVNSKKKSGLDKVLIRVKLDRPLTF